MNTATKLIAAASVVTMTACAATPAGTRAAGPGAYPDRHAQAPYQNDRYQNDRYYNDGRYADNRDDDRRYDDRARSERYWDERARRYYYIDQRTGNTYWENGDFRSR